MCSNLLVRHYYLSCLCLYSLSLCKNKYVSWSTTPIYSVLEAIFKRRFLHRKNQLSHSPPMPARQCSPAIAKARFPPCTICSRNRQYTEKTLKTEILPRQKRGFYMLILADWAVAISFYSLLNLLHPVWKSLSPSVFSSQLACGNLSFYIL